MESGLISVYFRKQLTCLVHLSKSMRIQIKSLNAHSKKIGNSQAPLVHINLDVQSIATI